MKLNIIYTFNGNPVPNHEARSTLESELPLPETHVRHMQRLLFLSPKRNVYRFVGILFVGRCLCSRLLLLGPCNSESYSSSVKRCHKEPLGSNLTLGALFVRFCVGLQVVSVSGGFAAADAESSFSTEFR